MAFEMKFVDSSGLDQIGYDQDSSELAVVFKNGTRYIYSDVPQDVFDAFSNASSKGTFLNEEIKQKGYLYRKE